jgi:hypothetical protein
VVEIVPVRVVESVPARVVEMVPAAVVEMVPVLVVEIVPVLVVEMVPLFATVGAVIARTNIMDQMIDLTFFIALLLVFQTSGELVDLKVRVSSPSFGRP